MAGLGKMMKQLQQVQSKVMRLQEEMAEKEIEATSGGGAVRVVANGKKKLLSISISPEAVDPEDLEKMCIRDRYKVYIIDEVHMLTHEAFNALLKTLEEPPPGVIFILATTDPSKLPATVISRCQRLDFRLLTLAEIKERIEEVANQEDWPFEEEALLLIARLCEGAMRDALGLLEQAYALGEGRVIMENVYILTGLAKEEAVGRVVEALVKEDIVGGLTVVREIAFGGKDLYLFLKEQMVFFKQLLVAQSAGFKALEDKRYEKMCIRDRPNPTCSTIS